MPSPDAAGILEQWLAAINAHDVAALAALMAEDFVFIDPLGKRTDGAKSMETGWRNYFALCPDYWIRIEQAMSEGGAALLTGEAGGSIDGESWRIPAAWRIVIRGGRVAGWQVFADNQPVYEILSRRQLRR